MTDPRAVEMAKIIEPKAFWSKAEWVTHLIPQYRDDETLARLIASGMPDKMRDLRDNAINRAQALLAAGYGLLSEERERCAKVADVQAKRMAAAGLTHPEDSANRDRCYARAREAALIAAALRQPAREGETL